MTKARTKTKEKRLKNADVPALPAPEYVFDPEVIKAGHDDEVCKSIQVIDPSKKAANSRKKKKTSPAKSGKKSSASKNSKADNKDSVSGQLPDKLVTEIQGIILIALSLMLLTGLTINSDSLLCSFSNVLTRLAGYGAYLFSLLFWLWGFERFRGRTFFRGYMDYLAWSVSFLTLIFLSQSLSSSGGSIGETLWPIVNRVTGPAGATVFLSALTIISFLLVAEILFSDFIVNAGRFIVWASIRIKDFMKWLFSKSEKGMDALKGLSIKLFELFHGFYKETFGSARKVDDNPQEFSSDSDLTENDDFKGVNGESDFSSTHDFTETDEYAQTKDFNEAKNSYLSRSEPDFEDSDYENSDDFEDSPSVSNELQKTHSLKESEAGMSSFARDEIVMEACEIENSSEFVSRIDTILGSSDSHSGHITDAGSDAKDIQAAHGVPKTGSEKGFLARGLKKMANLIPGSSLSGSGPSDDDFEVETFESQDEDDNSSNQGNKNTTTHVNNNDSSNKSNNDSSKKSNDDSSNKNNNISSQLSDSGPDGHNPADPSFDDEDDFYEPLMGESEEEEEIDIFFQLPPITLLDEVKKADTAVLEAELREKGDIIISTLMEFKIKARILEIVCGPSVTQFQIQIAKGVKVSKVLGLQENIGMNLAIHSVRIEAPIPGKSAIGVEIPNSVRTPVHFREIVENMLVKNKGGFLNMGFGTDIAGRYVCADLARMPHLLVAGATGSGKSVCMNTIICSILFESTPKDVKFIMVDPKMVEMTVYKDIPHLLVPPIIDAKEAAAALNWCVEEMEKRYELLSLFGVRNIESFNDHIESGEIKAKASRLDPEDYAKLGPLKKMPYIVVVIDELADLMLVASKDVETSISRIAAKARAIGIHLVIATQRPSVNVITGVIKANLPSRIAFAVSSVVDSKTILDRKGAELLLGRGDMLFSPVGQRKPTRLQGAFISDEEVERLCDFLREQSVPDYNPEITRIADDSSGEDENISDLDNYLGRDKELVIKAARHVVETNFASASGLQRNLRIGYARAGRVVDILEKLGIISSKDSKNNRKILMTSDEVEELFL